jgi:NAD(P)-dependent dehydrogenase (short-subunit alcohol dehydrogenase family)
MKGKVAIITGAFGILGRAVAEKFAGAGAQVVAVDLAAAPSGGTLRDATLMGGVDLSKPDHAQRVVDDTVKKHGRLDIVVNVAGGFRWQMIADADAALWDLMFTINLKTASNMSRAAIAALSASGDGRIVNVGAGAAQKAVAGMGPYTASKAGVHRLTEALAEELKGKVRVNAVLPSIIDTPQNRADMADADFGKWVKPADLAAVILYLASDEARAVTGALVPVTGLV